MDELKGRQVARNMNLPMTGSIGVLISAYRKGVISAEEAEEAFFKIRNAGRHIGERLIMDALSIIHGDTE